MATKHGSTATPVAATEDVIQALMEHLVQPLLPTKAKGKPDLSRQQSVAKQMHAVVLLYNYYHRKQFPKLEYLDGESFCKVAVNAKRNLLAFMKDMSTLNIRVMLENQFSITEQQIVDACNICISLDASRVAPRIDEWPVSKIAVLLTDSTEKNCLLLHGSITAGVWSLIEKNLGESNDKSENTNKKRKTANSPLKDAPKANVSSSRALAFSAVKETTDIDQGDLIVLGSHVVYSLSEVKKSTHVYVMKCTRQIKEDVTLVPITEVIDSLQGPLIVKVSGDNEVSSVVEYFHLLPYAEILSDLHSRELLQNISEDVDVDYSSNNKKSPTPEVNRNIDILKKGNATSGRVNVKEKGQSHISGSPNAAFKSQSLAARNPSTSEKKNKVTESIFPTNHVGGKRKCYEPVITNTACKIKKDFLLKIPTLESENQEIQDLQAINDVQRKFDLEKQEIVKSEKEKADKRIQEMETKCDQKLVESKEESRQYLMRVQEEHDSLICSLQKKHDRMESSLMADYNKELEKIRLQGQEELDSKTTLLRKEHDVQMRALRRQYDDKCQKLQEELEFQKPKENGLSLTSSCLRSPRDWEITEYNNLNLLEAPHGSLTDMKVQKQKVDLVMKPCKSQSQNVQAITTSKGNGLFHAASKVLQKKRNELSLHLRRKQDEIAQCEKTIQSLSNGEEDLMSKIHFILEACDDSIELPQIHKEKFQSLGEQQSCKIQELDDICCVNNWPLPIYHVFPSNGEYRANVIVQGKNFECSDDGAQRSDPRKARDSAAAHVLGKLRAMAKQV